MRTYFAFYGDVAYNNGFVACTRWADAQVLAGVEVVKIAEARGGDSVAVIIAEVDEAGVTPVSAGRTCSLKTLARML